MLARMDLPRKADFQVYLDGQSALILASTMTVRGMYHQ